MIILVHEAVFFEKVNDLVRDIKELEGHSELMDSGEITSEFLQSLGINGARVIRKYVEAEVALEEFINSNEPLFEKAIDTMQSLREKDGNLTHAQQILYEHSVKFLELCDKERRDQKHIIEKLDRSALNEISEFRKSEDG